MLNIYLIGEIHIEHLEARLLTMLNTENKNFELINNLAGLINYIDSFYKQVNKLITGSNNLMLIEGYKVETFFQRRGINKEKLRTHYWMDKPDYETSIEPAIKREERWLNLIKNLASINIEGNMFIITGLYHLTPQSPISKTNLEKELEEAIITEKLMNYQGINIETIKEQRNRCTGAR